MRLSFNSSISGDTFRQSALDMAIVMAAFLTATYIVLPVEPAIYLLHERGLVAVTFVALTIVIGMNAGGASRYSPGGAARLVHQICLAVGVAFLIQALMSLLVRTLRLPAHLMLMGALLAGVALLTERVGVGWISRRGADKQPDD